MGGKLMYAIGIMSGTSLDGVDVVLVKIEGHSIHSKLEVLGFDTFAIPNQLVDKIKMACSLEKSNVALICSLNFELGHLFSDCVIELCQFCDFDITKLDFIASHGQTIWHIPFDTDEHYASTLQIGEPSIIAYRCGCQVISDFRVMDMAAGGQGAPLVPFSDYILYSKKNKNIALWNIGGISNVTFLNGNLDMDAILAFDTGPGNMMINEACHLLFGQDYDTDGCIALSGTVHQRLLTELMSHPFLKIEPPKSTGREMFGEHFVKDIVQRYRHVDKKDIVTTFTIFTAKSMGYHYQRYLKKQGDIDTVIITGGGAHNKALMLFLQQEIADTLVVTLEELGGNSDAKEAVAFVILGNETLHHSYSNVKSATGANASVILGKITPKLKEDNNQSKTN